MPKLSNTEAPTITEQTANETNVDENAAEGSIAQDSDETAKAGQNGDPEKAPADRHHTLDEILKSDPAIKADYDRKISMSRRLSGIRPGSPATGSCPPLTWQVAIRESTTSKQLTVRIRS